MTSRPTCARCPAILRADNPGPLCDPCAATIASCAPYVQCAHEQAPPDVNLLYLVAGIALIQDALHPDEPVCIRKHLAEYGVDAIHTTIHEVAGMLERHFDLILEGESRKSGYVLKDWKWWWIGRWWQVRKLRSSKCWQKQKPEAVQVPEPQLDLFTLLRESVG